MSQDQSSKNTEIKEPNPVKRDDPDWSFRRKMFVATLAFCGLVIIYLITLGDDTRVNETIALGCFGLSSAIIGFYTGFSAWESTKLHLSNQQMTGGSVPAANPAPIKKTRNK